MVRDRPRPTNPPHLGCHGPTVTAATARRHPLLRPATSGPPPEPPDSPCCWDRGPPGRGERPPVQTPSPLVLQRGALSPHKKEGMYKKADWDCGYYGSCDDSQRNSLPPREGKAFEPFEKALSQIHSYERGKNYRGKYHNKSD